MTSEQGVVFDLGYQPQEPVWQTNHPEKAKRVAVTAFGR